MNEFNETVKRIQKLFEAPYVMPGDVSFIDDLGGGVVLGQRAILEGKLIATINFRGSELRCYEIVVNDFYYNVWLNGMLTRCYVLFKKREGGIVEKAVEQGVGITGLARYLYKNYYLEKYAFILSDSVHTNKGKKFWVRLCGELPNDKYKIELINSRGEYEILASEVKDAFSKVIGNFSRIKVSKR